jgi:dynein heavy chain 1
MQAAWMKSLQQTCDSLNVILPTSLSASGLSGQDATKAADPLSRFFSREVSLGRKLLQTIRGDLQDLLDVCQGRQKQTNRLRELIDTITKGEFDQHVGFTALIIGMQAPFLPHGRSTRLTDLPP